MNTNKSHMCIVYLTIVVNKRNAVAHFYFFFVKQRGYFCWAFHIRFRAWLTQNLTFCFKRLAQYKALSDSVFFAFDKNVDKFCLKSHFVFDSSKVFSLASKGSKISEFFLFLCHFLILNLRNSSPRFNCFDSIWKERENWRRRILNPKK